MIRYFYLETDNLKIFQNTNDLCDRMDYEFNGCRIASVSYPQYDADRNELFLNGDNHRKSYSFLKLDENADLFISTIDRYNGGFYV